MWLRLSLRQDTSPNAPVRPKVLTTVPTNPLACRTTAVSSMLISKGGRWAGAAAQAALIHWK